MRIHEIENKNVWRGSKRMAQADEYTIVFGLGSYLSETNYLPTPYGFWVKFNSTTPQAVGTFTNTPGSEARIFYSLTAPNTVFIEGYFGGYTVPNLFLPTGVWHLFLYDFDNGTIINGNLIDTTILGTDNPTISGGSLGRAFCKAGGLGWLGSDASFGSRFVSNTSLTLLNGIGLPKILYNMGRGCDVRKLPQYGTLLTHWRDFNPSRITPAGSNSTLAYPGYSIVDTLVNAAFNVIARRIGLSVLPANASVFATGSFVIILDATFTAPQGTLINAYVPEVGPQFVQADNWITGTCPPWAFDGAGMIFPTAAASGGTYALAVAPLNQAGLVRGVMEGMVYPSAGGRGFVLLSNAAGTDMIRCQVNRNGAAGTLTLYIIFDYALQAGAFHLLEFTAAGGGELIGETDGSNVTAKYVEGGVVRAQISRTAPSPYSGGHVGVFAGESIQNTISRFTVTRFT